MTGVREDTDRGEHSEDDAETESALFADVAEVLHGERTLWRAAERIVTLAAPHVDEVCLGVPITAGFNGDIVSRTIVRRAHDALAAVTVAVDSPARANARVHLRAIAEDLIFAKWLLGLDAGVATQYVQRSARVEALRAVKAQQQFLPVAYRRLETDVPDLGFGDVTEALSQARDEMVELCQAQGWGKRGPSVRSMAEAADLLPVYEFFYFLSSKAVHANLHEMARMVWGTDHAVDISSKPFAGVHADLAIVYGVWLFDYVLSAVMGMFEPVDRLLASQAYCVWLALILAGPARRGQMPLLIHPRELRI
ncbi:DUF5677 domain-containing protein [Streptomyces sp. NPDC057456]|uniref:DUF5677 domain-containing protein n=1 Tax=Streptomyces sp. NPDC057456 TaxID=3346139 RepID=UPI00369A3D90